MDAGSCLEATKILLQLHVESKEVPITLTHRFGDDSMTGA